MVYFSYGETELNHLRAKDRRLGAAIDAIGPVTREVFPDLFEALVLQIISQQVSTKGAMTVWTRLQNKADGITPERICQLGADAVQGCGMTMRKARYIYDLSISVRDGALNLDALHALPDAEVCKALCGIHGIGTWTAEMLMLLSMQRPNILSYGDLGILRGLRKLYRHREITPALFEKYRRRYAPYASVASLYLWAISSGALDLTDPAPKKTPPKQ